VNGTQSRSLIHLGLLVAGVGALIALVYLSVSVRIHVVLGLVFVALVGVHLVQRRKTIGRLASQFTRARGLAERGVRQAGSDVILAIIFFNVLISGLVDWLSGDEPISFPLPPPLNTWHKASSIVLVVYLIVHVCRRRKRLRRSGIR